MDSISINVNNESSFALPQYATTGASGMDLRANIPEALVLKSLERMLIPTGIRLEIPEGFEGQIRPRSGLALKQGLTCLNSPGTIDSDYRGEIKVLLVNLSSGEQDIQPGDRIAQIVFCPIARADLKLREGLDTTERGEGGFGHTGIQ